jgi:hypothetical protein
VRKLTLSIFTDCLLVPAASGAGKVERTGPGSQDRDMRRAQQD